MPVVSGATTGAEITPADWADDGWTVAEEALPFVCDTSPPLPPAFWLPSTFAFAGALAFAPTPVSTGAVIGADTIPVEAPPPVTTLVAELPFVCATLPPP